MLSSLGIYVDKNLIKYAKLKKVKDSYKVESFNVEVFEDLKEALEKVINETNSHKIPVCINISNELYNYFDVFSILEKKDITKSLDIEFEILCSDKGYDHSSLESRYVLRENKENFDKYKSIYISANKNEVQEQIKALSNYKLFSMTPVSTSITNLISDKEVQSIAIINIENETKITTIIDGQIHRVDVLNSGMEDVVEKINKLEMSWKKAYDACKNITIYNNNDTKSLDENENEYIDIVMPVLYKIASETKKIISGYNENIDKVYITGMGATINNIDIYFQDFLKHSKVEVLKPFFIDSTSVNVQAKELIEVNSAIALALDGVGYLNKELNFAPFSKMNNLETIVNSKEDFDIKNWKQYLKGPYTIQEKVLLRAIAVFLIATVGFTGTSAIIGKKITNQIKNAEINIQETTNQIENMDNQLSQIQSHTSTYATLIGSVDALNQEANVAEKDRVVAKNAIPNFLNKVMFIIPQQVQITSIKNTRDKHIVIEAVSEKYEQLGYFVARIKNDKILTDIQSTSGTKSDSLVQITIEGDLP